MSEVINGVPRELLEQIETIVRGYNDRSPALKPIRALLTAKPQASDELPFAGFDPKFCHGSNPDNPQTEEDEPQASAAQSAPAGEREAFEAYLVQSGKCSSLRGAEDDWQGDDYYVHSHDWRVWQARAAWQRAQSAPVVPEGLNKSREQWQKVDAKQCANSNSSAANFYLIRDAQQDIERLHRALSAAPAQPAARQEPVVHACAGCVACEGSPGSNNNPCHVCGGTVPAAHDQGEVQSRERWTAVCGHWQDTTLAIHGERTGHIASGIDEDAAHAIVNAHNEGLPPIVAASTGQEV